MRRRRVRLVPCAAGHGCGNKGRDVVRVAIVGSDVQTEVALMRRLQRIAALPADSLTLIHNPDGCDLLVLQEASTTRVAGARLAQERPARPLWLPASQPFSPFAVPAAEAPLASLIIPVYGQLQMTLDCLRALTARPPALPVEIIVVDDGSPDDTAACLPRVQGLRYHLRPRNGGFIAACNDGAALARGRYLVFLNNDTLPQPGWLEALLGTFDTHPGTGLAGAKLVYPDGRLQEAGGVVFADGSAWNYGRFDSPDDPRYDYVREADYLSGAAVAIPRTLFEQVGGFDTRYAPAYYEDTDLSLIHI